MALTFSAPRKGSLEHPDHPLLIEAQQALAWWSGEQPSRPTSSLTGGGAIESAETALGALLLGRPVLALPSATFALLVALRAAGVGAGDEVLISGVDWPAARAAGQLLGAGLVPVPVRCEDLTMDPDAAAELVSPATRAVVVTHLNGLVAAVPQLRDVLPAHVVIIEDCAQAFGATRDGKPAGTFGDYAVFSLGPGKAMSAGEMGLLVASTRVRRQTAVACSQHPVRQLLSGILEPRDDVFIGRPAPLAAVLAAYKLSHWPKTVEGLAAVDRAVRELIAEMDVAILGSAEQQPQPGCVPIIVDSAEAGSELRSVLEERFGDDLAFSVSESGGVVDRKLSVHHRTKLMYALRRVRLIGVGPPTTQYPDGSHKGRY